MIDEKVTPRQIYGRVVLVDDGYTGGGIGGSLRDIYRYLFGLKRNVPRDRIPREINAIAALIQDHNLAVYPKTIGKLANIVAWSGEHHADQDNTAICLAALNAIEVAMEWPIRDLNPGPVIAKLQSVMDPYRNLGRPEVVKRVEQTLRAVEQRRVLVKPKTRSFQ